MSRKRADTEAEATIPSERMRTFCSLAVSIHLLVVFVVLSANLNPSPLQSRLVRVLRPYAQLLNFDPNFTPYQLTHGTSADVDHSIEILPAGKDPTQADNWLVLPDSGWQGEERYQRYQRMAGIWASLADQDEEAALIAKSIAEHFVARGITPSQVRCRAHFLQRWDQVSGGAPAQQDPYDATYYRVVYAANTIVSDTSVDIVKIDDPGQVARPRTQP